ncbi:hypothetical protein L210DRAFT_3572594 [Boletus edulis BED1]|uniref:F-box domain-containing protein n=1 Tax=Boletus edulis BED1 TaxID=1328754 RepID=A0AAD4G7N4_BOLED|nr:hypothetical protein L210DRAFT_3572594 [Boletus edulis BED1]
MPQASFKRRRHRKPKPGAFFELNLDVLFLIAEYLHPKDLLSLSRTCQSLRELLMDESSTLVWKTARRQVDGLPDCPPDLTEQEYADLVFDARCHMCGRRVRTVLWYIRCRYCADCKLKYLIDRESCDKIIRDNDVLATEELKINKEDVSWVDVGQMESFLDEYDASFDKKQLLDDRKKQYDTIWMHAYACESWQGKRERERKRNLEQLRREREQSIFERLKEHGYGPEIEYFGQPEFQSSYKSAFRSSKLLTDKVWSNMWPEWLEIMKAFRSRRLQEDVYPQRRRLLAIEYENYMTQPSLDTPSFDLLPHVVDITRLPLFEDIIKAPEATQMDGKPFASAFAQLPAFVGGWKKKLDVGLAKLIKIPSRLFSEDLTGGRVVPSSNTLSTESSQTSTKLQLACALFRTVNGVFAHPEVFSMCRRYSSNSEDDSNPVGPIVKQLDITFMEEAAYIVHVCGLDPNVATVDDMDRRNARLRCLWDDRNSYNLVMNWRNAILYINARGRLHGSWFVDSVRPVVFSSHERWQLISDEHVDAIQAIEQSIKKLPPEHVRCLLCRPSMGDALQWNDFAVHFTRCHNIDEKEIKQGVHYMPLGICNSPALGVEMVQQGEEVTFRVSPQDDVFTRASLRRRRAGRRSQ